MAGFSLLDATTYVHGFDFTGKTNQIAVAVEVEDLDATVFGSGDFRTRTGGLREVTGEHSGFWEGDVDAQAFANLGQINRVVTVSPNGLDGSPAYLYQAGEFSYEQFGAVGELTPFSLSMSGSSPYGVVRGRLARAKAEADSTGQLGEIVVLPAPVAGQYVYASLHIFTAGTTITVQVQSDNDIGFASPTTRGTIGPITTAGGVWMTRVAGPFVGETHWRFNVSAITGTFEVAGAIAVQ